MFVIHMHCFICEAGMTFLSIVPKNLMFQVVGTYFLPISDKVHRNRHAEWVSRSFRQLIKPNSAAYPIPTFTACAQLSSSASLLVQSATAII
jgi:hypothetical protein